MLASLRRAEDLKNLAEALGLPDRVGFFDSRTTWAGSDGCPIARTSLHRAVMP